MPSHLSKNRFKKSRKSLKDEVNDLMDDEEPLFYQNEDPKIWAYP